ncbi:MAG: hypothetical protein M1834_007569 [Cirrosporium novae-zelandiae]|nr:MAG: hypothetical protein M1834_007569 [Cirrosporium novae-zelandiae]
MVLPFGISIGDFIAVGKLAHDIAVTLSDTRAAVAEYASLIELLRSLATSIQIITNFISNSAIYATLRVDQAFMNGIRFHVTRCQQLMEQFLVDSRKYIESITNGRGGKVKITLRIVTWSLYKAEDVQKLEQRLGSHLDAFQRYLIAISIQIQVHTTSRVEASLQGLIRTVGEIHTYVQVQQNRPKVLGYHWEGDDISSHITLNDALGRKLTLPTALCRNLQTFQDTLEIIFRDHPGFCKVVKQEYEIVDEIENITLFRGNVFRPNPFIQNLVLGDIKQFKPGAKLGMNVLRVTTQETRWEQLILPPEKRQLCPNCGTKTYGRGLRRCPTCNTQFQHSIKENYTGKKIDSSNKARLRGCLFQQPSPLKPELPESVRQPEIEADYPHVATLNGNVEDRYFRRIHDIAEHLTLGANFTDRLYISRVPLIYAAEQGNARRVQDLLLNSDDDPNSRDFQGWTALQKACLADEGRPKAVAELLIKHGADVNASATYYCGMTALQAACSAGNKPLVDSLLVCGADIHALPAPWAGRTALQAACEKGAIDIVLALLEHGANVNEPLPDFTGLVIFEKGVQRLLIPNIESLGQMVRAERIRPNILDPSSVKDLMTVTGGKTALQHAVAQNSMVLVEVLIRHGADVHVPALMPHSRTALQEAAYRIFDHMPLIKLLVDKYGVDVNEPKAREWGYTALEAAVCSTGTIYRNQKSFFHEGPRRLTLETVQFLLAQKAKVTSYSLQLACAFGYKEMVELLLHRGVKSDGPQGMSKSFVDSTGFYHQIGKTAIETAEKNNQHHIVRLLEQHQALNTPMPIQKLVEPSL